MFEDEFQTKCVNQDKGDYLKSSGTDICYCNQQRDYFIIAPEKVEIEFQFFLEQL
jgi:hypothetical protein